MATKTFISGNWVGGVWSPVGNPTAADDVILNGSSGACTINSAAVCRSLDCNGYTNTLTRTSTLAIGDGTAGASNIALRYSTGMTVTGTGTITFLSSSATQQTITTNGKSLPTVIVSSGNYSFSGAVTATGTFAFSGGTLTTNNQICTFTTFSSTLSGVRSLTLGSSSITCSAAWTISGSNITLSAGTSSITVGSNFTGGGLTYNNVTLSAAQSALMLDGGNTFANLIRNSSSISASLILYGNQTITTTFSNTGTTKVNRLLICSDSLNVARTITAAAVSLNGIDLRDITGAGAASWNLSAVSDYSGNCGGNTLQALGSSAFTTPTTQTSTGTASFAVTTHGWTSRVPLPQDTVVISNAFSAGRTVTFDMPRMGSVSFATCTGTPIINISTSVTFFQSLDLTGCASVSGSSELFFQGRGNYTLNTAGLTTARPINIEAIGGKVTLQSDINFTILRLANGEIDHNGYNATITQSYTLAAATVADSGTRICSLGSGTVTLTGTGSVWGISSIPAGLTVNATNSEIIINNTSTTLKTFNGSGFSFGKLTITGNNVSLIGNNSSFTELAVNNAGNSHSPNGLVIHSTQRVDDLTTNGSAGILANIKGSSGTIYKNTSGNLVTDYMTITSLNFNSTSGNKWYAGANSVDGGSNNANIIFTAVPVGSPMYYYRQLASLAMLVLLNLIT